MNFKLLFGLAFIGFGAFLLFGDATQAQWPQQLGHNAVALMKFCTDNNPYSGIVSLVLGIATLMTMKKY